MESVSEIEKPCYGKKRVLPVHFSKIELRQVGGATEENGCFTVSGNLGDWRSFLEREKSGREMGGGLWMGKLPCALRENGREIIAILDPKKEGKRKKKGNLGTSTIGKTTGGTCCQFNKEIYKERRKRLCRRKSLRLRRE